MITTLQIIHSIYNNRNQPFHKVVFPLCPKTLKKHYKNTIGFCAILLFGTLKGFVR